MKKNFTLILTVLMTVALIAMIPARQESGLILKEFTPDGYSYSDAAACADCKGVENSFMPRAAGVDISGEKPLPCSGGWLGSVHSRSQSHEGRIDTSCAWCHAPLTPGAVKEREGAAPIAVGTWQGVTCSACHPGSLERSKRESLLINFTPGADPSRPESYIFRSRTEGRDLNAQCRFCHHQSHDLPVAGKPEMLITGELRCVDCHMSAFKGTEGRMERFHNFKVEANLPHSCSGGLGRSMTCHEGKDTEWFKENIGRVKGPRKTWPEDKTSLISE